MARFFLPCTRTLAVRCLGQHGGWWRTPKHEHAEPRRSVGWAHDMENFRCDGAADRGGNGGFDPRTHKRLRSARVYASNFKNMPASYTKPRLTIPDPIFFAFVDRKSINPPAARLSPSRISALAGPPQLTLRYGLCRWGWMTPTRPSRAASHGLSLIHI